MADDQPAPSKGEGEEAESDSAPAIAGAEAGTEAAADGDAGIGTGGDGKEEEEEDAVAPGNAEGEREAPLVFEKTSSAPTTPAIEVDPSLPTDNFTRLSIAQSMSVEALRKSSMWIEVQNASTLFTTGRRPDGYKTTGNISIGKDIVQVENVDFEENRVQIVADSVFSSQSIHPGMLVTNEGAAPMWRWLKGKGGYNDKFDVWVIRHALSKVVIEIGYGCLRIRPRPNLQVKFVTHDGDLMTDEGLSWNEVIDGTPRTGTVTYQESWMSCPTVVQMETTDSNHPCGGGHPVPPWDTSFGVWSVSTTSKRVLMLKNYNCTFEQDMGSNKEPAQVPISLMLNAAGLVLFLSKTDQCFRIGADGRIINMDKKGAQDLARRFWKEKD